MLDRSYEYRADIVNRSECEATIAFELVGPSSSDQYHLKLIADGDLVKVSEVLPGVSFPKRCPTRHINEDGSFCIGFKGAEDLRIGEHHTVTAWWERLTNYLRFQRSATRLGIWPLEAEWAHGDAAKEQIIAEQMAKRLGDGFLTDLKHGHLVIRHVSKLRSVQLVRNGQTIAAMRPEIGRIRNLRGPCICETDRRRLTRKECSDHADTTAQLILAVISMKEKEDEFVSDLLAKDFRCCDTMKVCPFRSAKNIALEKQ